MSTNPAPKRGNAAKPISLHPLTFEEAMRGLLSVDPADLVAARAREKAPIRAPFPEFLTFRAGTNPLLVGEHAITTPSIALGVKSSPDLRFSCLVSFGFASIPQV